MNDDDIDMHAPTICALTNADLAKTKIVCLCAYRNTLKEYLGMCFAYVFLSSCITQVEIDYLNQIVNASNTLLVVNGIIDMKQKAQGVA